MGMGTVTGIGGAWSAGRKCLAAAVAAHNLE
jgi:hypothetical protein